MVWVVLVLWIAVLPLLPLPAGLFWFAHPVTVIVLGLLLLPRLLRPAAGSPPLRAEPPVLGTLLAVLSLVLAIALARPEAPRSELLTGGLTGLAHATFFLLCLGWLPGPEASADRVRGARRALIVLLALLVLGQFAVVLHEGQLTNPLLRPDGTLGNPNVLGTLAGTAVLALVGLLHLRRWGLLTLLVLLLPLVVLTRSRGALLATGVTLLLLAVHWKQRALLIAVAGAAVLVLSVPNPLRDRVMRLESGHNFTRPFLWHSALERCADAPLGIGPGLNRYAFPAVAWDPDHPWLLHQRHSIGLTHNVFLTLTLEWGWLAGLSLLALTGWTISRLLARRLLDDDPLCLGGALGACVLFLELQVDGIEQNPVAFSVFLLLLATAVARVQAPAAAGRGVPVPRWLAATGLLLALGLLGAGVAWHARATALQHRAAELVTAFEAAAATATAAAPETAAVPETLGAPGAPAPPVGEVRAALDAAETFWPGDAEMAKARLRFESGIVRRLLDRPDVRAAGAAAANDAEALERRRQLAASTAEAFAAFERAGRLNGLDPEVPGLGAELALLRYRRMGHAPEEFRRYVALAQAALLLDPLDVEARFELAQEARQNREPGLMEEQLAELFRLEPDYASAWHVLARLADADGALERALYCYVRASEAVFNCQLKAQVPNPSSAAFYQRNLDRVDLVALWARIWELRRELYF